MEELPLFNSIYILNQIHIIYILSVLWATLDGWRGGHKLKRKKTMRDSGQRNIKRTNVRVCECVYVYAGVWERERQTERHAHTETKKGKSKKSRLSNFYSFKERQKKNTPEGFSGQ